jgi:hypothetical protein
MFWPQTAIFRCFYVRDILLKLCFNLFEEIFTAVNINVKFLRDVMECSLVEEYEIFRGKFTDEKRQVSPKHL